MSLISKFINFNLKTNLFEKFLKNKKSEKIKTTNSHLLSILDNYNKISNFNELQFYLKIP